MDAKPCGSVTTRWRSRYWLRKRRWEAPDFELGGKCLRNSPRVFSAENVRRPNKLTCFFFFSGISLGLPWEEMRFLNIYFWFWGEVVHRCVSWKGVVPRRHWKGLRGKITGVSEHAHYIPHPVHGRFAANDPYSNEIVIETGWTLHQKHGWTGELPGF